MTRTAVAAPTKKEKGPTLAQVVEAVRRIATSRNVTEEQQTEILGLLDGIDAPPVES